MWSSTVSKALTSSGISFGAYPAQSCLLCLIRSNQNFTSRVVTGLPSDHSYPFFSVMLTVLLPSL